MDMEKGMTDTFAKDHAAGKHQREIVSLIRDIEPSLNGHPRMIIIIALMRIIAGMLGPANEQTRKNILHEMPITIRNILTEMDRMMEPHHAEKH
jgi:hypothetical protein